MKLLMRCLKKEAPTKSLCCGGILANAQTRLPGGVSPTFLNYIIFKNMLHSQMSMSMQTLNFVQRNFIKPAKMIR